MAEDEEEDECGAGECGAGQRGEGGAGRHYPVARTYGPMCSESMAS